MDRKIEEMIALGVAYGINCTACLEYHKKEAVRAGLTAAEMLAAIKVANQVKAGATELIGQAGEGPCCRPGSECCP